jgi:DNA-binding YbaB/EbfC family protein
MFDGGGKQLFDMESLMENAKDIQKKLQETQEKLTNIKVTGTSAANMISVTMNGKHETLEVRIDPKLYERDVDLMPDLIAAAYNDANRKLEQIVSSTMGDITSNIPGDLLGKLGLNDGPGGGAGKRPSGSYSGSGNTLKSYKPRGNK